MHDLLTAATWRPKYRLDRRAASPPPNATSQLVFVLELAAEIPETALRECVAAETSALSDEIVGHAVEQHPEFAELVEIRQRRAAGRRELQAISRELAHLEISLEKATLAGTDTTAIHDRVEELSVQSSRAAESVSVLTDRAEQLELAIESDATRTLRPRIAAASRQCRADLESLLAELGPALADRLAELHRLTVRRAALEQSEKRFARRVERALEDPDRQPEPPPVHTETPREAAIRELVAARNA